METKKSELIWINFRTYPKSAELLSHSHVFFHFVYVISGSGSIKIGEEEYSFISKHIYLTPPDVYHEFYSGKDKALCTIEIKFDMPDCELKTQISSLPYVLDTSSEDIEELLTRLYKEDKAKRPFSSECSELLIEEFLFKLLRINEEKKVSSGINDDSRTHRENSSAFSSVIEYINDNLENDISLDKLAEIACLEKNYFIKKFSRVMMQTPMEFIRCKRIETAKDLLLFSDMNITQIAYSTGFKSIHHFSNTFFKYTGIRPNQFKNAENKK